MKGGVKAKSKAEAKKADSKLSVKRKGGAVGAKKPTKKEKAAAKDPNKPKRPASAFFVFMEEFRQQFKEENPNTKGVAVVGKAGGEKWKSMSEAEKAPYQAKSDKRKAEYNKNMQAYNKKLAGETKVKAAAAEEEDDSDKSKSEVNDEEDDGESDDESVESDDE